MAISGTMDDLSSANDADDEWEADEAELDDIMRWWNSFGFDGFGRLAQDAPKRMRVKDEKRLRGWRGNVVGSVVREELDAGLEESAESTGIETVEYDKAQEGLQLDTRAVRFEDSREAREGSKSLPSSPMLDLDPGGVRRDNDVPIPMGFNLGHDLGDFLNWETQHVQSLYLDG